jgi:hypothetical protein
MNLSVGCIIPPREEGCPSYQRFVRSEGGCVAFTPRSSGMRSKHGAWAGCPPLLLEVRLSRAFSPSWLHGIFLIIASTPPHEAHEEGNAGLQTQRKL